MLHLECMCATTLRRRARCCLLGEARFSFFAGSTPPTSVGVAASAERLESGYRRGFPRVRDECFEKLMEVTPESGSSQDRRKYIPVCAKIPGRRRFRHKIIRRTKPGNRKGATGPAPSMASRAGANGPGRDNEHSSSKEF